MKLSATPDRFKPLRRASPTRRRLLLLVGPLLWVGSLVLLDVVLRNGDEVWLGVLIAAASFCVALAVLVPLRARRIREERDG
jgi:hypothetical protein